MAKLHFVTGKGGVGKSTVAAALTVELSEAGEGPVLLIDVQGSGRALKLLGLPTLPYANSALPETRNAWGCRILPRETFKQYFGLLMALGRESSTLAQVTQGLRGKIAELLLENKIVSAFVDACPGLEPVVLLGKVHWEATEGTAPESDLKWGHVVVDSPSTGHFVMLFRSTYAMLDVFAGGPILKQAQTVKSFTQDPLRTKVHVVSTPEELPLQEAVEMTEKLKGLGLKVANYVINRAAPPIPDADLDAKIAAAPLAGEWKAEAELQSEFWQDQRQLVRDFRERRAQGIPVHEVAEMPNAHKISSLASMRRTLAAALGLRSHA